MMGETLLRDKKRYQKLEMLAYYTDEFRKDLDLIDAEFNLADSIIEERGIVKFMQILANKKIRDVSWRLEKIIQPVMEVGPLFKNKRGRYQLCGTEWQCGCGSYCEVLLPLYDNPDDIDKDEEYLTWIPTTVEHNGKDYYFTFRPDAIMEGRNY